ncbi:MAG: S9 family peptidase [Proteobacteria bacterium]|nr:S9 family peptidase [Pseudomonadota bacterium]
MLRTASRCAAVLGAIAVGLATAAVAADPPPHTFTVDRYLELQSAREPRISPDGKRVVYTRTRFDKLEDKPQSELWVVDADGQHHRFLAKGSGAAWSPDSTRVAYLGEGEPKGAQIYVTAVDLPGPPTQLTRLLQPPANLHWSPDGRWIGFTMVVPDVEKWNVDLPAAPEGAKWAKAPRYTERLHYRQDRVGFTEAGWRHLFLVAADGGAVRQVTSGNWSVGSVAFEVGDSVVWGFMPDGRSAVIEGYQEGDRDLDDRDSNIYSVDLASGATRRLTTSRGAWQHPTVSADGRTIAYVGFAHTGDSYRVADLWTMNADGSNPTLRSEALDREPSSLSWSPDGTLYFTAEDRGSSHLYAWTASSGVRAVSSGAEVVREVSAGRGAAVAVRGTPAVPSDIALWDKRAGAAPRALTSINETLLGSLSLGSLEELWFDSSGGARIQGWLVKPPGFDATRHYPLLLEIHGGPHGMYNVAFSPMFQNFAANGYVVLYLNPRGSTGYGSAFGNAIAKHYPGVDFDDLMAGVDAVLARGFVDTKRLYVSGCSGGGVLSSWVISHTDRFAAAAVRCPVTDWISMAGETDIPLFTYRFFQKPFWEDPSDWLAESSLMHVGKVKTPTLLMTGELDMRTPIPQTEEFYAALKMRGVPAALLRFDGEYHGTGSRPSNWMRTQLYMMSWFQKHGGMAGEAPPR